MLNGIKAPNSLSQFLTYLAQFEDANGQRLPSLNDLSRDLGIGLATLREQLEVARALGLVEVKPKLGTKKLSYTFAPAIRHSLRYALALNNEYFQKYADLRNHVEGVYWHEAVKLLTVEDKQELEEIVVSAKEKLYSHTIQVPHEEHRNFHLLIFKRLENPFVTGLLEAYWEAYDAVGLNVFSGGLSYLEEVWEYHTKMIEAINKNDYEAGYQALVQHTHLLFRRPSNEE
ncbi:MAG: FCD domain-containing protein [Anaerolineae bacterium]|nr:FCD domain-containing protein [Anaerolineae bacterium]MDK1081647.1 FCD domain-containing protein [Anaerolineae bacterium]MDK1118256.1 FCD domain-containing protein [Anaerolineae bacterium]